MHWEVEQKFQIHDMPATRGKLAELGVPFCAPIQQVDYYFNHPARDFGHTDEALRLRQIGEQNYITYKGPKVDAATKTRRELELPLVDGPQCCTQFAELLMALGFVAAGKVVKNRQKGMLEWCEHQVEVALDDVGTLGWFVELELSASDGTLEAAKAALSSLSERLNLGGTERRSYLELILSKKQ